MLSTRTTWTLAVLAIVLAVRTSGVDARGQTARPVAGVVVDSTGGVLPGARIEVTDAMGAVVQTAVTDADGTFRVDGLPAGRYQVHAAFPGFQTTTVTITVGARPPGRVSITLPLAGRQEEVTVGTEPLSSSANSDAVAVDQQALDRLPIFDRDPIAALSRFLDAGSIATGGVTLVVNGMEVTSLGVSASAIQSIKINQDPYSAEYSRPGRGRIEVLTKPGSQVFHGELNTVVRDGRLDARNAFAATPPSEHRRIFEGMLSGPVGKSTRASFVLSGNADAETQQAVIAALGPEGEIRATSPQPNSRALASGSVTFQRSRTTLISVRSSYEDQNDRNRGIGGTTLASAGTNYLHHEAAVVYNQQTILRPSLILQYQILAGHELEPTTSTTSEPGIVVAGAFTGGGAQVQQHRTESHVQASETLSWTRGSHVVQTGFQVPDWSLRTFDDTSDFGGTYYFASLDAYRAELPYAFVQQRGNGHQVFLEKVLGVYLKDDWQIDPALTMSLGLRYDWANYFRDNNNVGPRASLAFSPGGSKVNVIRAGFGVFYDKLGPVPVVDVRNFQPGGLQRVVLTNPPYPDPFIGAGPSAAPPSIVQFAPDIQVPHTLQYSLSFEHRFKTLTASVTYSGSRGRDLFRSRDVNAPASPDYSVRPDPSYGVVRRIESAGRLRGQSLQVMLRGKSARWFNGQAQYTLSRTNTDTGGLNWFPANDYDLSGEWARADFDRRHQLMLLGSITPGRICDLGLSVTLQSGAPYTETLGGDVFNNGRGNARPDGVARNSLQGAGYADVDLRLSRDLPIAKGTRARAVTIGLDVFNLLDRVNYGSYVGTVSSPLFGQPVTARAPRQLQLSARYTF
jgi:Carboxypeptidase regulatory-like domain/TonB dependent receptor-like, beta-barrel